MDMEEEAKRYDSHREDDLQTLQDDQVRAAILHGCQGEDDAVSKSMEQSSMVEAIPKDPLSSETAAWAVRLEKIEAAMEKQTADIEELQKSLQSAKQQISDLKMQMEGRKEEQQKEKKTHDEEQLRMENQRLSGEVESLKEEKQNLSTEVESLKAEKKRSEQQINDLKTQMEKYQAEKKKHDEESLRIEKEKQNLSGEVESLKKENRALQEQLDARFSRGWELFEAYRKVSEHTRQILHNGVFTQEASFMSFICGGAQLTALDRLWEALRDCVLRGQQDDAAILWDIFEYCLELVNASRTQAKYEILSVKVGDSFDSDCHTEGPNSKAQGIVRKVYLQGYRNTYSDRIMKKSIVQVG